MFKRLFFLVFGLGLGVTLGALVMKRVDKATNAIAPSNLAQTAGRAATTLGERLRAAAEETRRAAAERESELRAQFNVPSSTHGDARGFDPAN